MSKIVFHFYKFHIGVNTAFIATPIHYYAFDIYYISPLLSSMVSFIISFTVTEQIRNFFFFLTSRNNIEFKLELVLNN
jgi:hypothetical protein